MPPSDLSLRQRSAAGTFSTGLAALMTAVLVGGVIYAVSTQSDAIMASGQISMGQSLARRLKTNLVRGQDAELTEADDQASIERFRRTRLQLKREIGQVKTVLFVRMPGFQLADGDHPDSLIHAEFLVRGERGRRTVSLVRLRNLDTKQWRIERFEIIPSPPRKPSATAASTSGS